MPGDLLVLLKPLKTKAYDLKKWKSIGKQIFPAGAEATCLGDGKYSIQISHRRGHEYGAELSDAEAAEYLAKRN